MPGFGPKPARVPFQRAKTKPDAELIPGVLAELGLGRFGLALGWSRLRRCRPGRRPIPVERRKDRFARWLGCADMWRQRSLRRRIDLRTIGRYCVPVRGRSRWCDFRLGG